MKVVVSAQALMDGLRKVLSVVSTRSTIPVLSNTLIRAAGDKLSLATTDLEVSIVTTIDAQVEAEGETTLPAKKLGQIAATLPGGDVTLETDDQMTTTLSCRNAEFRIMGLDASEFPTEDPIPDERQLVFPAVQFGKTLRKIAYGVSNDQTRYVLNGILLSVREDNFTAVATDGRRLALVEKILDDGATAFEGDVILPNKVVVELQKLLEGDGDVVIRIGEDKASFALDGTLLTTRLVEGTYPNYRQVIPASFKHSVILPRESFADVLNRVSVVVTESSGSIKFRLENNTLELSATSADIGEAKEPLEVSYEGDPLFISFNPAYLKDPVKALDCDELTVRFNDEYKPVVILGDEGFLYVIMPMRN